VIDWADPIQRLIDKQLSSVWREHQLMKEQERTGFKVKEQFPAKNRLEDDMIMALDAKYFGGSRDNELLLYYAKERCYTQEDLAMLLGRSQSWVSKRLWSLSAEISGGWYA